MSRTDEGMNELLYLFVLAFLEIKRLLLTEVWYSECNGCLLSAMIFFAVFKTLVLYSSVKEGSELLTILAALRMTLSKRCCCCLLMLPP